jgi:hypothetical protein
MAKKARAASLTPASDADRQFRSVVGAFANDRQVHQELGKGFGSGSLKVKGKIFAMITSKGHFVVKLSRTRVDKLVAGGRGKRFDPGHGRVMKEWLVVRTGPENWVQFAKEARQFVGGGGAYELDKEF